MTSSPLDAPGRLHLLLPWLSGAFDQHVVAPNPLYRQRGWEGEGPEDCFTRTAFSDIRRALDDFVNAFDGSKGAAFVWAEPTDRAAALDDEALGDLEASLLLLLRQGFGDEKMDDLSFPTGSLRFGVRTNRRPPLQWRMSRGGRRVLAGGAAARRAFLAAGAYGLQVAGPTAELVPFLMALLLTQPGMVAVKRCARRGSPPYADCPKVFIVDPSAVGQPQRFCSRGCSLDFAKQQQDEEQWRRRKQRKRR